MINPKTTDPEPNYDDDWDQWFQQLANDAFGVVAADPKTGELQHYRMTLPEEAQPTATPTRETEQ
jgi:hypothetical protein